MDSPLHILMVDDDRDDHVLFRHTLGEIPNFRFHVDFVTSYDQALEWMAHHTCDVIFIDYSLGERTGLELLHQLQKMGFHVPAIMFTGRGNPDVDKKAMQEGAADYLEKTGLTPGLLERTIRYALERHRTLSLLRERQKELERLSKKVLTIQEKERERIARELHDGTGSTLTAVKYALEEKLYYQNNGEPSGGTSLEELIGWVKQAMNEVRATCSQLRPDLLTDMGLSAAISSLCKKTEKVCEDLKITRHVEMNEEDVGDELKIAVYRILQEALNNITKHSQATQTEIHLSQSVDGVVLSIRDNGSGFSLEHSAKEASEDSGMGLASMRDRTELFSGQFEIRSQPGQGTAIRCFWPHMDSGPSA
jgi:signal transduction histidine kinase